MTKQEIKDLVASKIEGQGNQVDLGSALSAIIGGIVDLIPEGGGQDRSEVASIQSNVTEAVIAEDVFKIYIEAHEDSDINLVISKPGLYFLVTYVGDRNYNLNVNGHYYNTAEAGKGYFCVKKDGKAYNVIES